MLESKLKRASRKTHHHAVPLAIQDEEQGFPVTDQRRWNLLVEYSWLQSNENITRDPSFGSTNIGLLK
jgi:hypothetical protein